LIQTRSEKFSTKHKIKITEVKQTTREQDANKTTIQKLNQKLGERLNTKRWARQESDTNKREEYSTYR
jgi:hypothetical protein